MEFFNSLNLTQIKGGTKLKQGDLGSVLSYSLTDENGQEITSFDNKTAYINLVLDDKIWFTTTTLVDISRVTFRIDKAIPIGLYYLEIKIDDYIFPSDRDSIILIEEGSTPYDLKELVPNYDINMTLKGILSDLSQKGIDIRDLKTKMNAIYNNALADHAEITTARGAFGTVSNRLDDMICQIKNVTSGSPKGVYANLAALQAAKPNGDSGIYTTTDNGHWYYYNNGWKDGGVYQATGIADGSVKFSSIDKKDFNVQFDPKLKVAYEPVKDSAEWKKAENDSVNAQMTFIVKAYLSGSVSLSVRGTLYPDVKHEIAIYKASKNNASRLIKIESIDPIENTSDSKYATYKFKKSLEPGEYYISLLGVNFHWKYSASKSWYQNPNGDFDQIAHLGTLTGGKDVDMIIATESALKYPEKINDNYVDLTDLYTSASDRLYIMNTALEQSTTALVVGANYTPDSKFYLFEKKDNYFEVYKEIFPIEKEVLGIQYKKFELEYITKDNIYFGAYKTEIIYDNNVSIPRYTHLETASFDPSTGIARDLTIGTKTSLHVLPILNEDKNLKSITSSLKNEIEKKKDSLETNTLTDIIRKMKRGNAVTISLYGDSTYYGHKSGAVPLGTRTSEPVSESLQKYLRSYFLNENITVNNYATNGRQAQQDSDDWDTKMANDKADVIFINFGINDSNSGKTAETFYSQMETLVQGALKTNKAVILETANQVLTFDKGGQGMGNYTKAFNIKEFVDVTRQVVKDYNINLLDGYKRSLSYINEFFNPTIALPDGMHPSDDMYKYKAVQMMSMFTNTSFSKLKSGQTLSVLEANFNTTTPNAVADSSSKFGFKYRIKDISASFGLEKQSDIKVYIKSTASMTVYVNGLETPYISSDGYITIKDVHSNAVFIQIDSNEQTDIYGLEVV